MSRTGRSRAAATGAAVTCAVAMVLVPGRMLAFGHGTHDRSRDSLGYDVAHNLLATCAPDAILLSLADNETYPLWALQIVYGVRRDVQVINLELLNGPWYVKQLTRQPGSPIALTDAQIDALTALRWLRPRPVAIPVDPSAALRPVGAPDAASQPATPPGEPGGGQGAVTLEVGSAGADALLLPRDQIVLHLLSANAFRRPVYLSPAVAYQLRYMGLTPLLRNGGDSRPRLLPTQEGWRMIDRELLRQAVVQRYRYEAFAHPEAAANPEAAGVASWFRSAFLLLAESDIAMGDAAQAAVTLRQMDERMPEARLPLQSVTDDLRVARLEWLTGDRAALSRRVHGMVRRYTLSPHDTMTMASLLWDPLGERAAADALATAVLSRPGAAAIDPRSVLNAREKLLGSSVGIESVSAWLHRRLGGGSGTR